MSAPILFEEKHVRRAWNQAEAKGYFSVVDVIAVLTESLDPGAYCGKLKERLGQKGNQTVTNCHGLKMTAADGKQRLTDMADTEHLLRLIQSITSPKAEPFKLWLARVGFERLEEAFFYPGMPALSAAEASLVAELAADGLAIQHKFRPEPLYRQTGQGHYAATAVDDIRHAKAKAFKSESK